MREAGLVARVRSALCDVEPARPLLVAVSGGADSTALLHLLVRAFAGAGPRLVVAHLDHGLRAGSGADREFVVALAARLGIECRAAHCDVRELAVRRGLGLEEAGRHARYSFFAAEAERLGAAAVALGHTLDDQAETVLLRLARGAGTAGLAAMRPSRDGLWRRPLLGVRRGELREFLASIGEGFREDPSGANLDFARNRVRHEVLVPLSRVNPRVAEAIARAADHAAQDEDLLAELAERALPGPAALDPAALLAQPRALARRAIRRALLAAIPPALAHELGHEHVDAVLALAGGVNGPRATDLPGGRRLARGGGRIVILPPPGRPPEPVEMRLPGDTTVAGAGIAIHAEPFRARALPPASGTTVAVAAAALGVHPRLRAAAPGDRFRPLGSPGSRPLGRYLRDRGVGAAARSRQLVLEGEAGILWVVGHQVGEPARVGPAEPGWLLTSSEVGG